MKNKIYSLFLAIFFTQQLYSQDLKLWYKEPAAKWTDALPIGNGRIGAMVFGGAALDHIQFNEATLWTGRPREYQHNGAVQYLPQIRQLLSEGKQKEAEALAEKQFMGTKDPGQNEYDALKADWYNQMRSNTARAAVDDTAEYWRDIELPMPNGWEQDAADSYTRIHYFDALDGAVWFRKEFTLPEGWAGKDLVLELGRIRDADITFINGHRIGETEGTGKRKYTVPANTLVPGKNILAIQVFNYFDKGGPVGEKGKSCPFNLYQPGKPAEVVTLLAGWKYFVQNTHPPAFPQYEASYQPFGDLSLSFFQQGDATGYRRSLDIARGIATTSFEANGVQYTREYIAGAPANAIIIHLAASRPGSINFSTSLSSVHPGFIIRRIGYNTLVLYVQPQHGALKGVAMLRVQAKRTHERAANTASVFQGPPPIRDSSVISISDADEATLYLTAATNFVSYNTISGQPEASCQSTLLKLDSIPYDKLAAAQVKDYQSYFNTFSIGLGRGKNDSLPTDTRIAKFNAADDPGLLSLFVQYARYLLIASSRPGGQPANLQGIWNDLATPPWGSKYTTNINLEMNYWPAEILNVSSCTAPLVKAIDELATTGKATAREHYGAPGWVLHHNTDLWRGTAPINASNHGIWVSGGAWLCHHLWEHYLYTQDKTFLQQQYPVMKEAARFFLSFLVKDPVTGWLISTPSNSPEHGGLVAGPAMDHQIIRQLFDDCIAAAQVLNTDAAFRQQLKDTYRQIAPNQIGKYGQLQEWLQDKDDTTDHHRHISHLWGVYPGADITWKNNPDDMRAARKSLLFRGDSGTGWSIAWKINLWARFKEGDHALRLISRLLSPADEWGGEKAGLFRNMFDAHPPFQIDGNFGAAAGIAEMLLQSHDGCIELLPALPAGLPNGEVKGICARGGFVLNIKWENGKLIDAQLLSTAGGSCIVKYGKTSKQLKTLKGKTYKLNGSLN